jgi:hypothetical protein
VQACAKHLINKCVAARDHRRQFLTRRIASRSTSELKKAPTSTTGRSMRFMRTPSCGVSWRALRRACSAIFAYIHKLTVPQHHVQLQYVPSPSHPLLLTLVDLINGTYACENDKIMNDIIKREFGFQGCEYSANKPRILLTSFFADIMSDWSGKASVSPQDAADIRAHSHSLHDLSGYWA